jgi:hypothetical protein
LSCFELGSSKFWYIYLYMEIEFLFWVPLEHVMHNPSLSLYGNRSIWKSLSATHNRILRVLLHLVRIELGSSTFWSIYLYMEIEFRCWVMLEHVLKLPSQGQNLACVPYYNRSKSDHLSYFTQNRWSRSFLIFTINVRISSIFGLTWWLWGLEGEREGSKCCSNNYIIDWWCSHSWYPGHKNFIF